MPGSNKNLLKAKDARDYTDDVRLKNSKVSIINTGSYVDGESKFTRILIRRK